MISSLGVLTVGITAGCTGDDGSVEAGDLDSDDVVVERTVTEAQSLFCFDVESGQQMVVKIRYEGDEEAEFGLRPTEGDGPSYEEDVTDPFDQTIDVSEDAQYCGSVNTEDGGSADVTIWVV